MQLPTTLGHVRQCSAKIRGRRIGVPIWSVSALPLLTLEFPRPTNCCDLGNTAADQLTRLQTCIVTLQNFRGGAGSGVGCPIVSTTWKELQAQLLSQVH